MITKLRAIKLISRIALGLVWFYEGLVPKILFCARTKSASCERIIWRGEHRSSLCKFSESRSCSLVFG